MPSKIIKFSTQHWWGKTFFNSPNNHGKNDINRAREFSPHSTTVRIINNTPTKKESNKNCTNEIILFLFLLFVFVSFFFFFCVFVLFYFYFFYFLYSYISHSCLRTQYTTGYYYNTIPKHSCRIRRCRLFVFISIFEENIFVFVVQWTIFENWGLKSLSRTYNQIREIK